LGYVILYSIYIQHMDEGQVEKLKDAVMQLTASEVKDVLAYVEVLVAAMENETYVIQDLGTSGGVKPVD
jgi:hypothetical protein